MPFSLPPTLAPANLGKTIRTRVPVKILRDLKNRALYGPKAPRSDECIFVDPQAVRLNFAPGRIEGTPRFRRSHSGMVRGGDWDRAVVPREERNKEIACIRHFRDGVPWEETGIFDDLMADVARKGSADGMRSLEEIRARYAGLDRLYEEIRRDGRIRRRQDLPGHLRREHGGIYIHIARDGTPLKAGGGTHRLAIARLLDLPKVPAQLGVIHLDAVRNGLLDALRREG